MKRNTITASLVGSAAAGLIAAAIATPAWAQATTYPEGTDCSAIQNSQSRMDCTNQLNESRQNPDTGNVVPDPDGIGNTQPGNPDGTGTSTTPSNSGTGNNTDTGGGGVSAPADGNAPDNSGVSN